MERMTTTTTSNGMEVKNPTYHPSKPNCSRMSDLLHVLLIENGVHWQPLSATNPKKKSTTKKNRNCVVQRVTFPE